LFSSSADNTIKIWYTKEGKLLKSLKGHTGGIWGIRLSKDESKLFSSSADNTIKIWDTKEGKLLKSLERHNGVNGIHLSKDESKLFSYSEFDTIIIWDTKEGKLLHSLEGHTKSVEGIQLSKDESKLFSYSRDKTIKIWDTKEGTLLHSLEGHTDSVEGVQLSKDERTLFSYSYDKTIKIWDAKEGKLFKSLEGHTDSVKGIQLSKDESKLFSSSNDNTIKIWDTKEGKLFKSLEGHIDWVKGIQLSKDESKLFSSSNDKTIKIWDTKEGKLLKSLEGHTDSVTGIQLSKDESKLFSSSKDNTIKIWDTKEGKLIRNLPHYSSLIIHYSFKELPNNQELLISYSNDGSLRYWDIETGKLLVTQLLFKDGESIYYTPDNYYTVQSQDVLKIVTFKKENKIYDFDQFDLKFNRPDIIMDRMRGLFLHKQEKNEDDATYKDRVQDYENKITLYKNYYEHRIKQNGFTPEQLSGENKIHAPEVSAVKVNNVDVESKNFDSKTKNKKVKLSFTIEDEKDSNLDVVGYKVFVQGVPLHGQYIKKFPTPEKRKTVEEEITLSTLADIGDSIGSNTIEISGFTSDGIESSKQKIYLNYENQDLNKKGNLYLVTLGTEKYKSGKNSDLNDLNYSIDDAEDLQKLFKEKNDKDKTYKSIIPIFLKDDEITRAGANKIRSVLSKSEVDDTVIFFISGHGVRADTPVSTAEAIAREFGITQSIGEPSNKKDFLNVYYYMTSTSSTKEPWKNGIPMESFRFALDGIHARQKILLIDTCQSGDKIDLTGYKPSKQRIEEIKKLRDSFKDKQMEKGITRIRGNEEEEELSSSDKYYRSLAYEWELRELSKMFPELRRGTGTIEISAASGTQSALESGKWKNGAFTFTIKEAILSGKAKDGADITAKSLRKYILDRVERLTEGKQIPMVTRDISGRDFRITK
jgi:WD40 repeat protein